MLSKMKKLLLSILLGCISLTSSFAQWVLVPSESQKEFDKAMKYYYGSDSQAIDYKKALEYFVKAEALGHSMGDYKIETVQQKYCSSFQVHTKRKDDFVLLGMDIEVDNKIRIVNGNFWQSEALPIGGIHWVGPASGIIDRNTNTKIFEANSGVVLTGKPSSFLFVYEIEACDIDSNGNCVENVAHLTHNSCHYYKVK